jgi:hypothetical protein
LFYVSAHRNAETLNIDISPEAETGRGLVDFKLSTGHAERVHIEMKFLHSKKIVQGFRQLTTYLKSEGVNIGFYVVIDFGIFGENLRKEFDAKEKIEKAKEDIEKEGNVQMFVVHIDARKKQSASKVGSESIFKPERALC